MRDGFRVLSSGSAAKNSPEDIHRLVKTHKEKSTKVSAQESADDKEAVLPPLMPADGADLASWIDYDPPPRRYIVENIVPVGVTGVVNSSGGVGKSNLLMLIASCVATGISIAPFKIPKPERVLLCNVEDSSDDLWRRFKALLKIYPKLYEARSLLERNLIVFPGRGKIAPFMRLDKGNPIISPHGEWIKKSMIGLRPILSILDTKSRLFGLDENSNDHAARWWGLFESIMAEIPDSTVLVAAHSAKIRSDDHSQQSNRGASAFVDNARLNIVLNHLTEREARKYGVERYDHFAMHLPKANYSRAGQKYYFQKVDEGVPVLADLDQKRFSAALSVLVEELMSAGGRMRKRELTDRAAGAEIRARIKEEFALSKAQFRRLVEYGIESTILENKDVATGSGRLVKEIVVRGST